jgi:hypothetical protein
MGRGTGPPMPPALPPARGRSARSGRDRRPASVTVPWQIGKRPANGSAAVRGSGADTGTLRIEEDGWADPTGDVDPAQVIDQPDGLAMPRAAVAQEPQRDMGAERRRIPRRGDIALAVRAPSRPPPRRTDARRDRAWRQDRWASARQAVRVRVRSAPAARPPPLPMQSFLSEIIRSSPRSKAVVRPCNSAWVRNPFSMRSTFSASIP